METEEFKTAIQLGRARLIPSPSEMVRSVLAASEFAEWDQSDYLSEPSEFVMGMRALCWERYLDLEKDFNTSMGGLLAREAHGLSEGYSPVENVVAFLSEYSDCLFELAKSNTNSRRSRAGKELELIIEILLARCGVLFDNQGVVSSSLFRSRELGKLVDCVVPGVVEYGRNKRDCLLLSMKTSLRERWQEVVEEMRRTGASEMLLLTLDSGVSATTIANLGMHNIMLVVPDGLKASTYLSEPNVYGFKWLLDQAHIKMAAWDSTDGLPEEFLELKLKSLGMRLEALTFAAERAPFEQARTKYLQALRAVR